MKTFFFMFNFFVALAAFANNPGVSYQGRIFKPDGNPLESTAVQFRMQVRSPGSENCLLYEEIQTLNMAGSSGIFSITVNDGNGTRLDTPTYQIDRIFANRDTMTLDPTLCAVGTTYTPNSGDGRKFIVYFKDETMTTYEPLPIMNLNYIPQAMYALEAQKIGRFAVDNILRTVDGSGNPVTAPALDPTQLTNLNNLLAGTSTQYATAVAFNTVQTFAKTTLPTCIAGQVLKSDGSSFSCVTDTAGSSTPAYSAITGATGTNTIDNTNFSQIWNWSTATTQSPMTMSADALTTGSIMNLTTSSASVNSTNGLLNVANSSPSTTGTLARFQSNSTAGSGLTILNNGNVGIGTSSPSETLEVNGNIKLPTTSSTGGAIKQGVSTLLHTAGTASFFAGVDSGNLTTTGIGQIGIGLNALAGSSSSSNYSVAVGRNALKNGGSGVNTAIGDGAMSGANFNGNNNTAVGAGAMSGASMTQTAGGLAYNVVIGTNAGRNLQDAGVYSNASWNTFVGDWAGRNTTTGSKNTFIGHGTSTTTTGSQNTFVGGNSGATNTVGDKITLLGADANVASNNLSNATAIGYGAIVGSSNSIVLGGTGANSVNVGIGVSNPAAQLEVRETYSGTTAKNTQRIVSNINAPSNTAAAFSAFTSELSLRNGVNYTNSSNGGSSAVWAISYSDTTGTVSRLNSGNFMTYNSAAGTVTNAVAVRTYLENAGGGTITNAHGIYVQNPYRYNGTISNVYGVYIADQTSGQTSNYAVYTAGNAKSYFGGNVGIGITSPGAKLDVTDTSTTTSAIIVPRAGNFTGTNVNGMIRYNTASTLFEFHQNGVWVNYTTVSDDRLKTNVEPVTHGLDIVNQLNPVYYDWDRSNPKATSFEDKHQVGFIAQEVEKVLPEVVNKGEDGYRSLEYGKMIAVVVDAVKSLYQRILGIEDHQNILDREIASIKLSKADKTETDAALTAKDEKIKQLEQENIAIKARLDKIEKMLYSK